MSEQRESDTRPKLDRLLTGITGFDDITGGGLPTRRACLITGSPGTGKTTFGNQVAFAHAARGGHVIVATLLTESHSVLLNNLQSFSFFDPGLVGERVHYMSVMTPLLEGGLDGTLSALRHEIRKVNATLLIVDGTAVSDDLVLSDFDMRRFAQRLEGQLSILGCTTVLLTSTNDEKSHPLWAHVNGVILLRNALAGARHARLLEMVKMRGVRHASGTHEFSITEDGISVFPRLESMAGYHRQSERAEHGLGTGIPVLDSMMGGGLMPLSTTLVMGTPGAGKTILGLHFLIEGADHGERGLIVTFHETADDLCNTARGIGLKLQSHIESGLIRVLWNPPLELSADDWAWQVLDAMKEHQPRRLFIDALTDVERIITSPERSTMFVTALVNEIRNFRATSLIAAEIDEYTNEKLAVPIPAASASMDNGILLRHVEVRGQLRRLVAVPKVRQSISDPTIREMKITDAGMVISGPFTAASGLLTGRATPHLDDNGGGNP
jgi:circadian clock protein KaiC